MRKLIVLAIISVFPFLVSRGTDTDAATQKAQPTVESAKQKAVKDYFDRLPAIPFAIIAGGEAYDLTDVWKVVHGTPYGVPDPEFVKPFILRGNVIQVTDDGLLVNKYGATDPIFVRGYRLEKKLIEHDEVVAVGIAHGRHQYTTTLGALKTVALFDCGDKITKTNCPNVIRRVTASGVFTLRRP